MLEQLSLPWATFPPPTQIAPDSWAHFCPLPLRSQALGKRKDVHVWELVLLELMVLTSLATSIPSLPKVKRRVLG